MNSPKATRVHLSIAKKIEILDFVKKAKLKKEVCLRYNLAQMDDEFDEEDSIPLSLLRERLNLPETLTLEDYVDEHLVTNETVTEDSIRNEIMEAARGQDEEEDDIEDEPEVTRPVCSSTDAKNYLEELRRYFESRALTDDDVFTAISSYKE